MKTLKILTVVVTGLFCIQTCTYVFYGKSSLKVDCFDNFQSFLSEETGELGVLLEEDLPIKSKEAIAQKLSPPFSSVAFYTDSVLFEGSPSHNRDYWRVRYWIEHPYPFSATVLEFNGGRSYAEGWKSEYFWCFGKWILIEKICTGQS